MRQVGKVLWRGLLAILLTIGVATGSANAPPGEEHYELRDGVPTAVITYQIGPEDDPNALILPDFDHDNVRYVYQEIAVDAITSVETKHCMRTVSITTATADQDAIRRAIRDTIEVEDDGYTGTLTLAPDSIQTTPEQASETATVIRQYKGLTANDPSLVEASIQQGDVSLTLSGITWTAETSTTVGGLEFTTLWTAEATYTGTQKPTGKDSYITTAAYSGELQREVITGQRVTVTYIGSPISTPPAQTGTAEPEKQSIPPGEADPTVQATTQPTSEPTSQPLVVTASQPTVVTTSQPTAEPTSQPTVVTTGQPTPQPTEQPAADPTASPTPEPIVTPPENSPAPSEPGITRPTTKSRIPLLVGGGIALAACVAIVTAVYFCCHKPNLILYIPRSKGHPHRLLGKYHLSLSTPTIQLPDDTPFGQVMIAEIDEKTAKKMVGRRVKLIASGRTHVHRISNVHGPYRYKVLFSEIQGEHKEVK